MLPCSNSAWQQNKEKEKLWSRCSLRTNSCWLVSNIRTHDIVSFCSPMQWQPRELDIYSSFSGSSVGFNLIIALWSSSWRTNVPSRWRFGDFTPTTWSPSIKNKRLKENGGVDSSPRRHVEQSEVYTVDGLTAGFKRSDRSFNEDDENRFYMFTKSRPKSTSVWVCEDNI